MAIYLNFLKDGLVYIPGACTAAGHEKWVEALSLYLPLTRQLAGSASDAEGGAPSAGGLLVINKVTDVASPKLMMAAHDGTSMSVTIDLPSEKGNLTFSALEAVIAQVAHSSAHGGDDTSQESVTISYATLTAGYHINGADASDASDQIPPQYRLEPALTAAYVL